MVESNDPEQPKFTLTLTATLLVDFAAKPAAVSIRDLRPGEAGEATLIVERSEDSQAEITSASIDDEDKFTLTRIDDTPAGDAQYQVGYRGRDSVGNDSARITIATTGENTPSLTVNVHASVALNLRYPKRIRFSRVRGVLRDRNLHITARDGEAPVVTKVEDPDGILSAEVLAPRGAMTSVHLEVEREVFDKLDHAAQVGPHTLVVHTKDKDEPRIEVEYRVAPDRPVSGGAQGDADTGSVAPGTRAVDTAAR